MFRAIGKFVSRVLHSGTELFRVTCVLARTYRLELFVGRNDPDAFTVKVDVSVHYPNWTTNFYLVTVSLGALDFELYLSRLDKDEAVKTLSISLHDTPEKLG